MILEQFGINLTHLPIDLGYLRMNINSRPLATQSDPDLQTARFQGRNTGNGCSAARFLRRNTVLGSGTGCWL